jgi:hypothetical protein
MSLEVDIIRHKEYLEVIVSGDYDMEEAIDEFSFVLSACKITGLSKVLIDFRKLHGEIYSIQKIVYSLQIVGQIKDYFASKGKDLQFAYVGKTPQVSKYKPGLEIAEREGIHAITSIDINEAFEWLGVKKT